MARGAQTADRALQLLLLVAQSERPLTLAELGELAGLNKSATYRLMQPLIEHELVARDPGGRHYTVGGGLMALAAMVMRKVSIRQVARPVMEHIADITSETVSLHVRNARNRICIEVIEGDQPIRRVVPLAEAQPVYAGTTGKTILAHLSGDELEEILAWAVAEGQDEKRLRAQIEQIREHGYIASVGDLLPGVAGLSVPIFDSTGFTAALTVSGPADRFGESAMEAVADAVRRQCDLLSSSLGHVDAATAEVSLLRKRVAR